MTTAESLDQVQSLLLEWAKESKRIEPNRLDIVIDADHLLAAVQTLTRAHWGYLVTITGLDPGAATGQLEVLYHFAEGAAVLSLRVRIPRQEATIASIQKIVPPASFFERELAEMFGIRVGELKDGDHLFLPEDWPGGQYPLRKDWTISQLQTGGPVEGGQ